MDPTIQERLNALQRRVHGLKVALTAISMDNIVFWRKRADYVTPEAVCPQCGLPLTDAELVIKRCRLCNLNLIVTIPDDPKLEKADDRVQADEGGNPS